MRAMDAAELRRLQATAAEDAFEVIDVRQPEEYRQGHIPGARLVPLDAVEKALPGLDPARTYVFHCHSGRRSAVAVRLAEEAGLAEAYNLTGGILAWNGMALPEAPRLQAFENLSDPADMLAKALELEKAAYDLYRRVLEGADSRALCSLMGKIADMELAHAKAVYKRLAARRPDLPPFEAHFDALTGDILEGGMTAADLGPWVEAALSGDCPEVAELALEIEFAAYDLYREVARRATDEAARAEFLDLAAQERRHGRIVMENMDAFLSGRAGDAG